MAAFLLGAWIMGCALMAYISVHALETSSTLAAPVPPVAQVEAKLGQETATLFVRHIQQEQARAILRFWEWSEILIGVVLLGCLFLATERRIFPLVLCGLMLVLVFFQIGALSPEIAYRGREADFPPGNSNVGTLTRLLALQQAYFGVEVMKLIAGGLLASYLFVFRALRRTGRQRDALPSTQLS